MSRPVVAAADAVDSDAGTGGRRPRVGGHRPVFHGWRIVGVFAITQTVGYGCLYYTFAVLLHPIAVAVPLHATVVRRATAGSTAGPPADSTVSSASTTRERTNERRTLVRVAVRDGWFWCLAGAFVAHGAAMSAMTVHLVGFLTSEGHPVTFAATVAGLLGVLSVTGRLLLTGAQRRVRLHRVERRNGRAVRLTVPAAGFVADD